MGVSTEKQSQKTAKMLNRRFLIFKVRYIGLKFIFLLYSKIAIDLIYQDVLYKINKLLDQLQFIAHHCSKQKYISLLNKTQWFPYVCQNWPYKRFPKIDRTNVLEKLTAQTFSFFLKKKNKKHWNTLLVQEQTMHVIVYHKQSIN